MMYFFFEVFFIYTGQNLKKSATLCLRTVLVEVMMMADLQTSARFCTATTKMAHAGFVVMSSQKNENDR
jgi:hypothetical protein